MSELTFIGVGASGDRYPPEIASLAKRTRKINATYVPGASGVYVFRCKVSKEILYVGESHTGKLFSTMTRHLAAWNDRGGHHGGVHQWHIQYRRDEVEVCVIRTRSHEAKKLQDTLILELVPRDNRCRPKEIL